MQNISGGAGIHGYDPVSYFLGKPVKGKPELSYVVEGVTYRFASAENKDRFGINPQRYLPAYGGWCAWAMLEGDKVDIDPLRFKIINGVNYLFYDGFWGNTLKKWNERAKQESEKTLVIQADREWQKLLGN